SRGGDRGAGAARRPHLAALRVVPAVGAPAEGRLLAALPMGRDRDAAADRALRHLHPPPLEDPARARAPGPLSPHTPGLRRSDAADAVLSFYTLAGSASTAPGHALTQGAAVPTIPRRSCGPLGPSPAAGGRVLPVTTPSAKPGTVERRWYVVDADGQNLGRLA